MAISRHLCDVDPVRHFARAYVGPGVYVLYDGRIADTNIVYVGKSVADVIMRVEAHSQDKCFDRVGIILPYNTDPDYIHNLEHYVIEEYIDTWGELPCF